MWEPSRRAIVHRDEANTVCPFPLTTIFTIALSDYDALSFSSAKGGYPAKAVRFKLRENSQSNKLFQVVIRCMDLGRESLGNWKAEEGGFKADYSRPFKSRSLTCLLNRRLFPNAGKT